MSEANNGTIIGTITEITGIVLIYSDNGKGDARIAQVGEEILSTDVIDDSKGSYKIELIDEKIEFLQNEDIDNPIPTETKNIKELLQDPQLEKEPDKAISDKIVPKQEQEKETSVQEESEQYKELEEITHKAPGLDGKPADDGGGKHLDINSVVHQITPKSFDGVIRAVGTDAMIGIEEKNYLLLHAIRSGGSGFLGDFAIDCLGINVEKQGFIRIDPAPFYDLDYGETRITVPAPPIPGATPATPAMVRELVASKSGLSSITDEQYDLVKGYNFAIEIDASVAINHLHNNASSNALFITIPKNATLYLAPYAGYLTTDTITDCGGGLYEYSNAGSLVYTKLIVGDTARITITKTVLNNLHNTALQEANNISESLTASLSVDDVNYSPLSLMEKILQTLSTAANNDLIDINLLQGQINIEQQTLKSIILNPATSTTVKTLLTNGYKNLVTLQEIFENQTEDLATQIKAKLVELMDNNSLSFAQLTAAKNAINAAVTNNYLVLYTETDKDVDYTVAVDGVTPYSTTGIIAIDAFADGVIVGNNGRPTGEVTVTLDHILDTGAPADPSLDKTQINLKVNVNFADVDPTESHIVNIPLPTQLVGVAWTDSNLPAGWSYSNGSLIRAAVTGQSSLNESLMVEVLHSAVKNIDLENLNFIIKFISTETVTGGTDQDDLTNNQLTQQVTESEETFNNAILVKELGEGNIANWNALDADSLFGAREVGSLNVLTILTNLKNEVDFINLAHTNKGTAVYENAINNIFDNSSITVTLSPTTAKVITGVNNATFDTTSAGVYVLDGPQLKLFYDNWIANSTQNSIFVGKPVEHDSNDFIVTVVGKVEDTTVNLMTNKQVIVDAIAEGIAGANPTITYSESNLRAGPTNVEIPINVQFATVDKDSSEKFLITVEIPGIDIDGGAADNFANMNFAMLGWDNTTLKNQTWTLAYDDATGTATFTTEVPGSFVNSVAGIFNVNCKLRFDTAAFAELRNATPAAIDQFPVTVKVQSQEVIPTDGSNKDFDSTDNLSSIKANVVNVINLPINTLFADEVQHDNDELGTYESVHLDFGTVITASGKTPETITVQLGPDLDVNIDPDVNITTVKLIWLATDGTVNEVYFDGTDSYTLANDTPNPGDSHLTDWVAAGMPDLQLVIPKYTAGTYELLTADVDYTVGSGGGTDSLYGQTMTINTNAVASGLTEDGVIVNNLALFKSGANSYISIDVKGTFLDTDGSENHQIIISLPETIDSTALQALAAGRYWSLLEQQINPTTGSGTQTTYNDKSASELNLGGGVIAKFSDDGKSIIIDKIGTTFDGTLYLGFNDAILKAITKFDPQFAVKAQTEEVTNMLPSDDISDNTKQFFIGVVKLTAEPFSPSIVINELQEDPNSLTITRIRELATLGQIEAIDITTFINTLQGNASNAKIEIALSGPGMTGVTLADHAGNILTHTDGKIVLTGSQLADYISSPSDMNIYLLPKQYAHENFIINVTGYNNNTSYAIVTAMPVEVNAVATGVDVATSSTLKAELNFASKDVDLTPNDNDSTKTTVLNDYATLKIDYNLRLADVLDKSQTHALVIDLRNFLTNVSTAQFSSTMAKMALEQHGGQWQFEISNKFNLYLVSTFDASKLTGITGNAVILLNNNDACFIKDGALVLNQDGSVKYVNGLNRNGIHAAATTSPETPIAEQTSIDTVIAAAKTAGGSLVTENCDYYTGLIVYELPDGTELTSFNGTLNILNVDASKFVGDDATLPINISIVAKEKAIVNSETLNGITYLDNLEDNELIVIADTANVNIQQVKVLENQGEQYKLDLTAALDSIEADIGYGINLVSYLQLFKAQITAEGATIDSYFNAAGTFLPEIIITVDSSLIGKTITVPGTSATVAVVSSGGNGVITLDTTGSNYIKSFYENWDESITGHDPLVDAQTVVVPGMLVLKEVGSLEDSALSRIQATSSDGAAQIAEDDSSNLKFDIGVDLNSFFGNDLSKTITIALTGFENGSIVHIPGASDITVTNGKITINGATLSALYANWYNNEELVTDATITIDTLAKVLNSTELNPPITVTGIDLSPLAGDDAVGTLVRDVIYNVDLSATLDTIKTALGAVSADTVTLTCAVNTALNDMTITFPGVSSPITIANGAFNITGANFKSFYDYWQTNIKEQNAYYAKLSTNGQVLLSSELAISSIAAVSSDGSVGTNGTIDLSGANIAGNTITGEFASSIHSMDVSGVLSLLKTDLQTYITNGGTFSAYFAGQPSVTLNMVGLAKNMEIDIPGIGKKVVAQGALTLSGDDLKAFYTAWDQAHTATQKLNVANIKVSQALYSAENFLSQINFSNSSGVTTLGDIKYIDVVAIATYQATALFTAGIEYVLANAENPSLGFADNAILNIHINSTNLKDITDGSETYTLTLNLNLPVNFTIPSGSGLQWQAVKDDHNNIIALKISGTGKELVALIDNPDFNTIKLESNMTSLNSKLDALAIKDSLTALVTMQIKATDIDGNVVVSNYSPDVTSNIDYTQTSQVKEYQGAKYKLDINAVLQSLFDDVDSDTNDVISASELNTFFADTDLHLKVAFTGVADGTEVYFPKLGYLKVKQGLIDLDYTELKEYFAYWDGLAGDATAQAIAGTVILGPIVDLLSTASRSCSISLEGGGTTLLDPVKAAGSLVQTIDYTLTLNMIHDALVTPATDTVTVTLSQVPVGTLLYYAWDPTNPVALPADGKITISGAANFTEIGNGNNTITFAVSERIVDLAVAVAVNCGPDTTDFIPILQSDIHFIDLANALTGINNDLAKFIDNGGTFDNYFADTTAININVIGISSNAVITFPVIGNKTVSSSGELAISGNELKQIYNAWKVIESNTNLTYTEKTASLLKVAMVPIHGAMYSSQSFATQVNYIDSAGINHADKQRIVTVSPVVTTDSYCNYNASFVYKLIDPNDQAKGFTTDAILRIKLSDLQLRDIDSSETHTLSIELGSNFDNLSFKLSGSSLWHIEVTDAGKTTLVFGPVTNATQALLSNTEFTQIDLAFTRGELFNRFDANSLTGILQEQVTFKIDNKEIITTNGGNKTLDATSTTLGDVNYGSHTIILENQGQFLYFNIADTLDNLAAKIVELADKDNDLNYPTADQINKYFENYFDNTDTAATVKITSGLLNYDPEVNHTYTVTTPYGTKIDLTSAIGGSYEFVITAELLQNIMLSYDPTEPNKNIFYFSSGDFDPDEDFVATTTISVADIPYEIDVSTLLANLTTDIGGGDIDTYFTAPNITGLEIDLSLFADTIFPDGAKIFIPGLDKYYTVENEVITLTTNDFRDFYKAWNSGTGAEKANIETINITYQVSGFSPANVTVTVNGTATPGGPYVITPDAVTIANITGSADVPAQSVTLDLTAALNELDAQIIEYLKTDGNSLDSFFSSAGARLNLVLTGIANGTEITIPGVVNPVMDANGLIISAAMLEIKNMIIDAGYDPVAGAPEYFTEHPAQKIIALNGIADDIKLSFTGVQDISTPAELATFSVQNGRIIIDENYIAEVYQAWLASDAYGDPSKPMIFTANPVPSGIASKDGQVIIENSNLQALYDYWKTGDPTAEPAMDSKGNLIVTIKPKQHTDNDFITQATLEIDTIDPTDPVYTSLTTFVDVKELASGIDEAVSYLTIEKRVGDDADIDYGPNVDQVGELGHMKLTAHIVYFNNTDSTRVLEIKVPKLDGVDFNFNQLNSDWLYDEYGDNGNGIIKYIGSFVPDPVTGLITIDSDIHLTFSTVQVARYIEKTNVDGYSGRQINADNLFEGEFILQAKTTSNNNTKLQTLTPEEADIAVYNIGLNKDVNWLDLNTVIDAWDTGEGQITLTFTAGESPASVYIPGANKYLTVVSDVLTITEDDVQSWKTYYDSLAGAEQTAAGKLMVGVDTDGVANTVHVHGLSILPVPVDADFVAALVKQLNFVAPETSEFVLDMNNVLTTIRDTDGGMDEQTIKITAENLADVSALQEKQVYISGLNQYKTFYIEDDDAIIQLSTGEVTAWYNYWNSLTAEEQTEAGTLVLARIANPWADSGKNVKVDVTDSATATYNKNMAEILAADQDKIPTYTDADIAGNTLDAMKNASIQYSLDKVFTKIYNILIKNDGVDNLENGKKFAGNINAEVLGNILTQGIGGTQASVLDFVFFSRDAITQSKQEPMIMFFNKTHDQELIGGGYAPLLDNKVSASALFELFQEWFNAQKTCEQAGTTLALDSYAIYIIAEDDKDVDFKFDVKLSLKDLTIDSENVTTTIIDEEIPVIVTKDGGTDGNAFNGIIETDAALFSVDTNNVNYTGTMHIEKIDQYLHDNAIYGYDGPNEENLYTTFSLPIKLQVLVATNKINKICIKLPIEQSLVNAVELNKYIAVLSANGWRTEILKDGYVGVVWDASGGTPVTAIDNIIQLSARTSLLTQLDPVNADLEVKVYYSSNLQQDLALFSEMTTDSTAYELIPNGFQNVLASIADYVKLNATTATPTDANAKALLEAADQGGVLTGKDNDDVLLGREGNDELTGAAGNDIIYGGGGYDLIDGGAGNDVIYGGTDYGIDWQISDYSLKETLALNPAVEGEHHTEDNGLGSRIVYAVADDVAVSDDISFDLYSRKEVADQVIDDYASTRSWCLKGYNNFDGSYMDIYRAVNAKYQAGEITLVGDDEQFMNVWSAMSNNELHISGSKYLYENDLTWDVGAFSSGANSAYLHAEHIPGPYYNIDIYKTVSYSLQETQQGSTFTVSNHDIIKGGTGADRIYSGASASIVKLGDDDAQATHLPDGAANIITYTENDITASAFDIIYDFGDEDKIDLSHLFDSFSGDPLDDDQRKDMIKVVQANTNEGGTVESTAIFIHDNTDPQNAKQYQIAILDHIDYTTVNSEWFNSHIIVSDTNPPGHDYLG